MPDETKSRQTVDTELVEIKDRAVVVTGGTTGIGRAIARLLVSRGARVLIFGREKKALDDALADIKQIGGGEIHGIIADVTREEDVKRVFETADKCLAGLDALVNNAALGAGSIVNSDPGEWKSAIETNLFGVMLCCREAVDRMKEKEDGQIVCIGSMSAKAREAGSDVYVATKSGIEGFLDSLAKEVNPLGIRISCIEPGLTGSEMTLDQVEKERQEQVNEAMEMMKAEDIGEAVHYVLTQPKRCEVALLQIRPHRQSI